jgi:hypothetical protein
MIRVLGEIKNVASIEMQLTISMTIGEWQDVAEKLGFAYPGGRLGMVITSAVRKVSQQVSDQIDSTSP